MSDDLPKIINLFHGTEPVIVHSHGLSYSRDPSNPELLFNKIRQSFFSKPARKLGKPDDLTIVTWSNRPEKTWLELGLDHLDIPYLVLGKEIKNFQLVDKLSTFLKAIKDIKTRYVLAMDSFDVLVLDNPGKALERFRKQFRCRMLFNSSLYHWPRQLPTMEFEKKVSAPPFQFLNGGCYIGETDYVREILTEANEIILQGKPVTEQIVMKSLYQKHYPETQIDDRCRIFQSLKRVDARQRGDRFYILPFRSRPLFLNRVYAVFRSLLG